MANNQDLYNARLKRVADAVALKEPDRMPMIPGASGIPYFLYGDDGASHKATYYDPEKAAMALLKYYQEFSPDIGSGAAYQSGKANEIVGSTMVDWPGRPGTRVPDFSTYQVIENEYISQEEYDEIIKDYSGFIFKKYLPRAYPGLKGLEGLQINPSIILGTSPLVPLMSAPVQEALKNLIAMAEEHAAHQAKVADINKQIAELGFPPYMTGAAQVPFDIISDYFRGTLGMFFDQLEIPDKIAALCDVLADVQIEQLQYLKHAPLPVKRVFFPLHKGMDGFISPEQYRDLYWAPFQKIMRELIKMGVTPIIFTEGSYDTRVKFIREQLEEFPPGSCIIHFEEGDFAKLKKEFEGIACLSGGMSLYLMEWGKKEQVADRMKFLIDTCAAGGGYLFNTGAGIENAKRENVETMFEIGQTYGKK